MATLNLSREELAWLDEVLDTARDGWDSPAMEAAKLADFHDKVRDLRGKPHRSRREDEVTPSAEV